MSFKVMKAIQSRIVSQLARAVRSTALMCGPVLSLALGCTTTQVTPLPPIPPPPPGYVLVPHPEGTDLGDLVAVFTDKGAPSPEQLKECDKDFSKLRSQTTSNDELMQGAREFVRFDPVKYHWCFYGKILNLEEALDHDLYVDQRQKAVVDAFLFATPIAKAFLAEYGDSRYLRWAITRYRRLSEFVFFRRLEQSPGMTSELVSAANPFALQRQSRNGYEGVLNKYGLINSDPAKELPGQNVAAMPDPRASTLPSVADGSVQPVTPSAETPLPAAVSDEASRAPASVAPEPEMEAKPNANQPNASEPTTSVPPSSENPAKTD